MGEEVMIGKRLMCSTEGPGEISDQDCVAVTPVT